MDTVSLKDKNLQYLEREVILNFLKRIGKKSIKDIGCGDASDTIHFAKLVDKVFVYDYSQSMLAKATKNLYNSSNVVLNHFDILQECLEQKTDVAITKRMLINLGNFENQKNAIRKIYNSLEVGGYYIMLETSIDGLENLNQFRKQVYLEPIPEPFHNTLFELSILKTFLEDYFIIEDIVYFSTYFFLTRVYNDTFNFDNIQQYDTNAKMIVDCGLELFNDKIIGPQFCMLLKKKIKIL